MYGILRIFLTFCYISTYVLISDCYEPKDAGEACTQFHYGGLCTNIKNCSVAMDALKSKGHHDFLRCGFEGDDEVVCCPDLSDRNYVISTTTTQYFVFSGGEVGNRGKPKEKRKCEKMCEKIYLDNEIKIDVSYHILNGADAKKGQFPHAVALGFEDSDGALEWRCGASLIAPRFLLTAAHCFICQGCSDPKTARMGIIDINDVQHAQDIAVKNATPHPSYNPGTKHNDIGILELVKDAIIPKVIYPACLYTEPDDPNNLQILGWGQTRNAELSSKSNILQFAGIQPVPIASCNSTVTSTIKNSLKVVMDTQICATTKSDACVGDSGGPLQIQKEQGGYAIVGIISWGYNCGTKVPGIYTRVARYLDWIEQMVWPD